MIRPYRQERRRATSHRTDWRDIRSYPRRAGKCRCRSRYGEHCGKREGVEQRAFHRDLPEEVLPTWSLLSTRNLDRSGSRCRSTLAKGFERESYSVLPKGDRTLEGADGDSGAPPLGSILSSDRSPELERPDRLLVMVAAIGHACCTHLRLERSRTFATVRIEVEGAPSIELPANVNVAGPGLDLGGSKHASVDFNRSTHRGEPYVELAPWNVMVPVASSRGAMRRAMTWISRRWLLRSAPRGLPLTSIVPLTTYRSSPPATSLTSMLRWQSLSTADTRRHPHSS